MANIPILEINGLCHNFKHQVVLNGLTFLINRGEILGMLGPNGAGKSTTFNMITELLKPDSGTISFKGRNITDISGYKCRIGVVPQDICLYGHFTVEENLIFLGKLYGIRGMKLKTKVHELIEAVQLRDKRNVEVSKLSGGMKRRINIAAALIHDPELILMDEPTVGIDPQSRNLIWNMIRSLKEKGKSIILTSHYVDEIEELSDRVVVIDKGSVIAEGTVNILIEQYGRSKSYIFKFYNLKDGLLEAIKKEGYRSIASDDSVEIITSATPENPRKIKSPSDDSNEIIVSTASENAKKLKSPSVDSTEIITSAISDNSKQLSQLSNDSNNIIAGTDDNIIEKIIKLAGSYKAEIKTIDINKPGLSEVFFNLTGRGLRE